jgi:hypothetical protein
MLWFVGLMPLVLMLWGIALPTAPGPAGMAWLSQMGIGLGAVGIPMMLVAYPILALVAVAHAAWADTPLLRRRRRMWALALFLGGLSMVLSVRPMGRLRMYGVRLAAQRATPLLSALDTYHDAQGDYPSSLAELVPDHLQAVPGTGMIGYPEWQYERKDEEEDWMERHAGNDPAYALRVSCTYGLNWDTLHYWPSRQYPDRMWGGVVERVDGWAYVHE